MKKIGGAFVGIDHGDVVLFSDFEHDGEMWTGEGPRMLRATVTFAERYDAAPAVSVSLSMLDISNRTNMRVDVSAEEVDDRGFVIVFRTWGDTRVARVRVAWQAIGSIGAEAAWDL